MQLFRGDEVQILGCIPNEIAENMRRELIPRLTNVTTVQVCQVTKRTISKMVVSVQFLLRFHPKHRDKRQTNAGGYSGRKDFTDSLLLTRVSTEQRGIKMSDNPSRSYSRVD